MSEKKTSKLKTWFGGGKDNSKKKEVNSLPVRASIDMSRENSSNSSVSSPKSGPHSVKSPALSIRSTGSFTQEPKAVEIQKLKKDTPRSPLSSSFSGNTNGFKSMSTKTSSSIKSPGLAKVSSMEKLKGLMNIGVGNKEAVRERRGSLRSLNESTPLQKSVTQPYISKSEQDSGFPKSPSVASYRSSMLIGDSQDFKMKVNELEKGYQQLKMHVSAMVSFEKENLDEAAKILQNAFKAYRIRKYYLLRKNHLLYNTTLDPPNFSHFEEYANSIQLYKGDKDSDQYEDKIKLIQHTVRGFLIRKRFKLVMTFDFYATKIQAAWRGYQVRNVKAGIRIPFSKMIKSMGAQSLATRKLQDEVTELREAVKILINAVNRQNDLVNTNTLKSPIKSKTLSVPRKSSFSNENGVNLPTKSPLSTKLVVKAGATNKPLRKPSLPSINSNNNNASKPLSTTNNISKKESGNIIKAKAPRKASMSSNDSSGNKLANSVLSKPKTKTPDELPNTVENNRKGSGLGNEIKPVKTLEDIPKVTTPIPLEDEEGENTGAAGKKEARSFKRGHQPRSYSMSNSEFRSRLPQPGTFGARLAEKLGTTVAPASEKEYTSLLAEVDAVRLMVQDQLKLKP